MNRHITTIKLGSALAALALLGTACGADSGSDEAAPSKLDLSGSWSLDGGEAGKTSLAPKGDVTIDFDGDTFTGDTGCNTFEGKVSVDGDAVSLEPGTSTMRACDPAAFDEQAFFDALSNVQSGHMDGDVLVLSGDATELTFSPWQAPEAIPLEGTTWELTGIEQGMTFAMAQGTTTMVFGEDGRFTLDSDCGEAVADWSSTDDAVSVKPLQIPLEGCQGAQKAQSKSLQKALAGDLQPKIEGQELRIAAGKRTFVFEAR